ncbi:hypothetical protein FOYG_14935 [Fusarium oxysporum NRRL 32931]|uniref:Uncharacterized protein n=1 Tax=Fusarium oxysporum NRRL 32931 TaxID=660029 RepID=W9HKN5_FUSOX|nr:hypothetical protein FOYG_14935 [Fusarium oxysporum NRRL 32931]
MDYLTNREAAIGMRLARAQELEDALTQELDDVLQAQDSLATQSQIEEDAEQYNQAAEQPDPLPSKAYLLIDPTDYAVITPKLESRFDQLRGPPVGEIAFFLRTAVFFPSQYLPWIFTLRHPNAATCPIKQRCEH